MSLVKCKECGSEVSSEALTCPKCGVTLRKKTSGCAVVLGLIVLMVVVFAVIGTVMGPPATDKEYVANPEPSASTEKSVRAQTLIHLVKKSLRNPDSLTVESVLVTDALAVCATYRAENGFSGMNVEQSVLSSDKTQALSNREKGFTALWNRECAGKTGLETKYLFPR